MKDECLFANFMFYSIVHITKTYQTIHYDEMREILGGLYSKYIAALHEKMRVWLILKIFF
jgi:hypothetical protein